MNKTLLIESVKYGPILLLLTCAIKCHHLMNDGVPGTITNWVNLGLNMVFLWYLWAVGREFGLCWRHQSVCRMCAWGYLYYGASLVTGTEFTGSAELTYMYLTAAGLVLVVYWFTWTSILPVWERTGDALRAIGGLGLAVGLVVMCRTGHFVWSVAACLTAISLLGSALARK